MEITIKSSVYTKNYKHKVFSNYSREEIINVFNNLAWLLNQNTRHVKIVKLYRKKK